MDFKKVNCVAFLVSLRAKALSYLHSTPQNGGATLGGGGWICFKIRQNIASIGNRYSLGIRSWIMRRIANPQIAGHCFNGKSGDRFPAARDP